MTYESHYIVTTDRYGKAFIDRLTDGIRSSYGYPKRKPNIFSTKGDGGLNKINKIIDAGLNRHEVVIILADGHKNRELTERLSNTIRNHPKRERVRLLVFESEIEDWILKSDGKQVNKDRKSSAGIGDYKKYKLPGYASKIDFKTLEKKDKTFTEFLKILDP